MSRRSVETNKVKSSASLIDVVFVCLTLPLLAAWKHVDCCPAANAAQALSHEQTRHCIASFHQCWLHCRSKFTCQRSRRVSNPSRVKVGSVKVGCAMCRTQCYMSRSCGHSWSVPLVANRAERGQTHRRCRIKWKQSCQRGRDLSTCPKFTEGQPGGVPWWENRRFVRWQDAASCPQCGLGGDYDRKYMRMIEFRRTGARLGQGAARNECGVDCYDGGFACCSVM